MNLLGEIFWVYVHGVVTKLSSKFHRIWTSFTQDLTFRALLAGCLGATGLTGLCNRSDRSLQASSAFRPRLFIAILADLGLRACGDFGT